MAAAPSPRVKLTTTGVRMRGQRAVEKIGDVPVGGGVERFASVCSKNPVVRIYEPIPNAAAISGERDGMNKSDLALTPYCTGTQ